MSFDPIANIMERDGIDESEAIRRYAVEAANPNNKVCEIADCPGYGVAHPPLPVDHQIVNDALASRFAKVRNDAVDEVERLARAVLVHDDALHEFVMGNGVAFFTMRVTDERLAVDEHPSIMACTLQSFINQWDNDLHLTGTPMRFTATGWKVTNW